MSLGAAADAPLRILCLGAHSDDIEIGCGGTLLRLLAERPGCEVTWVVLSATPTREAEARSSATEFLRGCGTSRLTIKDFRESFFPYEGVAIKEFFETLKRSVEPDVIFSHRTGDRHQDHRTVAEFTWNTFRNHLILEYEIPKYEGDLGHPNLFVPLSKRVAQRKVEILVESFRSQSTRTWFRPETFLGLMSVRGVESNAPEGLAEAFHAHKLIL